MKTFKITIGVVTALTAGIVLGILFAPHKGSKTRRNIARRGGEISEDIKSRIHQFGDFINEKLDSAGGVYKYFIRMGHSKI
jgi:gas vesicle protein